MPIHPYTYAGLTTTYEKRKIGRIVNYDDVVKLVSTHYRLSVDALSKKIRHREVVEARQLSWLLMKQKVHGFRLNAAAAVYGKFDHTTVIHGLRTIKDRIDTEPKIKELYSYLLKQL